MADGIALRQTEQQLEFALHAGRLGSWELDVDSGRITASAICREHFGVGPDDPFVRYTDVLARVHPDDRQRRQEAIDNAIASGAELDVEFRTVALDGRVEWILLRGRAAYEGGRAVRTAGVSLNITARKVAEARQVLLLDELNHRVKNTLATVQSIAMMTRQSYGPPSAFDEAFAGRIYALSRAHDLLTEVAWQGASLTEIVERTLAPYAPPGEAERIRLSGPLIRLAPNATVTLAMAFHELATNAAKYGSLSTPSGQVSVNWKVDDGDAAVIIDWRESGGPLVVDPTRRGFGACLIERGLPHELGGEAKISFPPDGLHCHVHLPISAKLEPAT